MPAVADGSYAMAKELLRRLNKMAADLGVTVPGRQVVCAGAAVYDCEQVAVMLTGWSPLGQEGLDNGCNRLWSAGFVIGIIRRAPAVPGDGGRKAPPVEAVNSGGELASDDCEVLLALASTLEVIGDGLDLTVGIPEGGMQAVLLTVSLARVGGLG